MLYQAGQIIATSHDLTPKGTRSWGREIPLFQGNLWCWNIIIWPVQAATFHTWTIYPLVATSSSLGSCIASSSRKDPESRSSSNIQYYNYFFSEDNTRLRWLRKKHTSFHNQTLHKYPTTIHPKKQPSTQVDSGFSRQGHCWSRVGKPWYLEVGRGCHDATMDG